MNSKQSKMRTVKSIGIAAVAVLAIIACTSSATIAENKTVNMENENDSLSYALGVVMGANMKGQDLDVNEATFAKAFGSASRGEETLMDAEAADQMVQTYFQKKAKEQQAESSKEGLKFLEENGKRPEVTTTASGLQYEVLTEGSGASPVATDQVTVHYTGKLLNGEVFDSSVERGTPATFGLNQVIAGWTEGVQLMKEGGKNRFYIPSELAYGERGAGAQIGPGATLIFDVELIEIKK